MAVPQNSPARRDSFRRAAGTAHQEALPGEPMAEIPRTRASLLLRLRDPRDADAWREFVDLYAPIVYGYARKKGLQDADASDLSQDVLRAVAGAIGRLDYDRRNGAFRNWLFTIVRNKMSNWSESRRIREQASGDTGMHDLLDECPAPDQMQVQWEHEWEQGLITWACEQARRQVSDTTWQAFWRTAVEGQPGKKVAGDLGIHVAAVYNAHSRVLARLKELVQSAQEP
jgi:RNA polymerase sigma factor (sigma-70 family)